MRGLLAALGLLALGVVLLLFVRGDRPRSEASPRPLAVAMGEEPPPAALERSESIESTASTSVREAVEIPSSLPPTAPVSPPSGAALAPTASTDELVVRARFVDEHGAPVAGGRLGVRIGKEEHSAEGTPDGEVALVLERRSLVGTRLTFDGSAPGRIHRAKEVEVALLVERTSYFLGELVLLPGGVLAGRVVDEAGVPVPGTRVIARPPPAQPNPVERVFLPWSWFGDGIRVSGNTGTDGSYRLEGVPCGLVEVLASDSVHLVARSSALELHAESVTVPDLVLHEPTAADRISGRVADADGQPRPGLPVYLMSEDEDLSYPSGPPTDAGGRFTILASSDRAFTLVARDPRTRREVKHHGAHAGDAGIELVFGAARSLELRATDAQGPVDGFRVVAVNAQYRGLNAWTSTEPGRVRLDGLPNESFSLYVSSPRHRAQQLGPFEPESAPDHLDVVLERAGGIAGLVLSGGTPVAGAEVHAHLSVREASFGWTTEHFATFVEPMALASTRTDDEGRFLLPVRAAGRYRLHASSAGRARGTSDWLVLAESASLEGIEIHLPPAGALEGRLLVAKDVEARGVWIGASDGEGHVELAQTVDDGRFQFPALAPGRWQVRRIRPGQERNATNDSRCWPTDDESEAPAWDVEVRSGATATFDIDVRDEVPCTLDGRLAFGGAAARGSVGLGGPGSLLDANGRFTLRAPKAGRYGLWFGSNNTFLIVPIELEAGANTWELDLPVGIVQLDNLPPVPPDARADSEMDWPEYSLTWSRDELLWSTRIQETPAKSARIENVPAGTLALHWRIDGASPQDERSWPVLRELELAPGQFLELRLP